ncbi:sirohydrochlorin chelatase [Phytohalomonas tamaricis]|uniref:sirohydrochlorin chelatase n=1 Tax=Phytohalomonas tamaricis TaxID=2081032 RepID=UPI000D0B73EC|nr:sirohydrochlorin chelatase [Phytohalomonas tamaricis]
MPSNDKPAILFVGHGSRDVEAVEEFTQLTKHFRERYPDRLCSYGFLEFARPVIVDGVEELVAQGATEISAIPGMLMAAGHAKNDIPSELNALQQQFKGIKINYGAELGVNPNMIRAARDRIEQSESEFGDGYRREETLLVVVGRGASDPDANSNISKITRVLEEGMGFGWAITCYSGVTTPLVPQALEKIHPMGFKRVIVFPYFLFTGRLIKKIYAWADDYQAAHPDVQVVKAPYLNDHPLVIDTFAERLNDIEHGSPNMNCQMCQYRVQIVGNEHKVGAPQEGHHHHVRGAGTDADHHHHDHSHHHHGHVHDHGHGHEHSHAPEEHVSTVHHVPLHNEQ